MDSACLKIKYPKSAKTEQTVHLKDQIPIYEQFTLKRNSRYNKITIYSNLYSLENNKIYF